MSKHRKMHFRHYASDCFLNYRIVAVYNYVDDENSRILRAEAANGKYVPGSIVQRMSKAEYSQLRDEITNNGQESNEALICKRFLQMCGLMCDEEEEDEYSAWLDTVHTEENTLNICNYRRG